VHLVAFDEKGSEKRLAIPLFQASRQKAMSTLKKHFPLSSKIPSTPKKMEPYHHLLVVV
jgi:hypothetical protein